MKIAYIEFGGSHAEIIYSFSHILHNKDCEVHLVCNESVFKDLPSKNNFSSIKTIPNDIKGLQQFRIFTDVKKHLILNQITHVIIGTSEIRTIRNFSFYVRKYNTTGIIHNVKKLEKAWTSLRIGFVNIDKFIVLGQHLLSNMKAVSSYEVSHFIPSYFPAIKKLQPIKPINEVWIVVPGGVQEFRRDYVSFIQEFEKITISSNVKIIFLGSLWSERERMICHLLENLKSNQDQLITFSDFVDYNKFHSYLQQADFILPLFKVSGTDWYQDKRMSGSTPLGIAYKVPFLLPLTYRSHTDISEYSIFYTDYEELFQKIRLFEQGKLAEDVEIKTKYEQTFTSTYSDAEANRLYNFITH